VFKDHEAGSNPTVSLADAAKEASAQYKRLSPTELEVGQRCLAISSF